MVQAAHHIDLSYMPGQEGADRAAIYRAMIAAAPQPAVQQWNDLIGQETHADADGLLVWCDEVDFAIPTPQADSQPAPVLGTIAHVGTGKTTLTGAITSALRAASTEADNVTAPAGGAVVTDDMVLAALRMQYPGAYGQYLRHPANGPKTSLRTESEIDTARRMIVAALSAAPTPPAQAADSVLDDAARYRFLASHCRSTSEHWGGRWSIVVEGPAPKSHDSEDDFDAAVDAARKQGANHD